MTCMLDIYIHDLEPQDITRNQLNIWFYLLKCFYVSIMGQPLPNWPNIVHYTLYNLKA